jgi:hypothetical protein
MGDDHSGVGSTTIELAKPLFAALSREAQSHEIGSVPNVVPVGRAQFAVAGQAGFKIARFKRDDETMWGFIDRDEAMLSHIAGRFTAWASLIANGGGRHALPRTGQCFAAQDVAFVAPIEDEARIFDAAGKLHDASAVIAGAAPALQAGAVLGVAFVGAPLIGRSNPLRSLFGYGLAWPTVERSAPATTRFVLAPALVSRGRFGDDAPTADDLWRHVLGEGRGGTRPAEGLADQLRGLNTSFDLRPGDLVLFPLT